MTVSPRANRAAAQQGQAAALQPAEAVPVRALVVLRARQEHLQVERNDVVAGDDVRVEAVDAREEAVEERALGRADFDRYLIRAHFVAQVQGLRAALASAA